MQLCSLRRRCWAAAAAAALAAVQILDRHAVAAVTHAIRQKPLSRSQRAYDMDAKMYSPDGSLYQVEYATKSVLRGALAVGVRARDGVLLAAANQRQSPLLLLSSVRKITHVDGVLACAVSGLQPDGRLLIRQARAYLAQHHRLCDEVPSMDAIAAHLSDVYLLFNDYPAEANEERERHARPLGVGLLLAGWDHEGPALMFLDPAGLQGRWRAKAMGKGSEMADKLLQARVAGGSEVQDLGVSLPQVIKIMQEVLGEEEFSLDRLEVTLVTAPADGQPVVRRLTPGEVAKHMGNSEESSAATPPASVAT